MISTTTDNARQVEDALLHWCNDRLRLVAQISADTNLLDEGYLDSLLVMAMVVYIEEQFGVAIDSTQISPRTFRSVRSLAAFVASRSGQ
jgi:acyl carrier protein